MNNNFKEYIVKKISSKVYDLFRENNITEYSIFPDDYYRRTYDFYIETKYEIELIVVNSLTDEIIVNSFIKLKKDDAIYFSSILSNIDYYTNEIIKEIKKIHVQS